MAEASVLPTCSFSSEAIFIELGHIFPDFNLVGTLDGHRIEAAAFVQARGTGIATVGIGFRLRVCSGLRQKCVKKRFHAEEAGGAGESHQYSAARI